MKKIFHYFSAGFFLLATVNSAFATPAGEISPDIKATSESKSSIKNAVSAKRMVPSQDVLNAMREEAPPLMLSEESEPTEESDDADDNLELFSENRARLNWSIHSFVHVTWRLIRFEEDPFYLRAGSADDEIGEDSLPDQKI